MLVSEIGVCPNILVYWSTASLVQTPWVLISVGVQDYLEPIGTFVDPLNIKQMAGTFIWLENSHKNLAT